MNKNKSYSKEFKFKVVMEVIKGDLSLAEIIGKYQVPRSVIAKWKKKFLESGANIFGSDKAKSNGQICGDIEKLHATIGRLKVENDFLQEVSAKLKL